jgi:hypothetical protein
VLLPGLVSLEIRAAEGLSTTARRKPLELVLLAFTFEGVNTQVTFSTSPAVARVTGPDSGVK